eukprot:NODE_6751_length_846_cov_77.004149_g6153_i0.p1 GENE.NODE_6751_length_846_cov_77.004149_g6153_i0~~NODE_6751_length_846_cov_77.004149_g6153_i0.p1  ORF type:complete len:206 (+),score=50.62 NODE_6751_length_846_cov_77.004149_g6153_i0:91-708(+)
MGCTSSVTKPPPEPAPPPEPQTNDSKDERKPSNAGSKPEQAPLKITPPQAPNPVLPKKDEDEQDLFVPPLTPRKLKEIEKWLELLPETIPEDDEELLRHSTRHRSDSGSQHSHTRSDKGPDTSAQQPTSEPVPVEQPTERSSLTVEHLNNHVKILTAKERQPAINNMSTSGVVEVGSGGDRNETPSKNVTPQKPPEKQTENAVDT